MEKRQRIYLGGKNKISGKPWIWNLKNCQQPRIGPPEMRNKSIKSTKDQTDTEDKRKKTRKIPTHSNCRVGRNEISHTPQN